MGGGLGVTLFIGVRSTDFWANNSANTEGLPEAIGDGVINNPEAWAPFGFYATLLLAFGTFFLARYLLVEDSMWSIQGMKVCLTVIGVGFAGTAATLAIGE